MSHTPAGGEGPKNPYSDSAVNSHLNAIKNEANAMNGFESPTQHAERLYNEVLGVLLDDGIQSDSEAIMILAKLDIVIEATADFETKAAAKEARHDIRIRYPNLHGDDSKR